MAASTVVCKACGHPCAMSAETCPNCGKSNPTLGTGAKIVGGFIALACIGAWLFSGSNDEELAATLEEAGEHGVMYDPGAHLASLDRTLITPTDRAGLVRAYRRHANTMVRSCADTRDSFGAVNQIVFVAGELEDASIPYDLRPLTDDLATLAESSFIAAGHLPAVCGRQFAAYLVARKGGFSRDESLGAVRTSMHAVR